MDFLPKGLKGFAAEAATALNRAVQVSLAPHNQRFDLSAAQFVLTFPVYTCNLQFTEERLGHSERTELDGYFEHLLSRAEQVKSWTEKMVASAEAVLQPNPGSRVEDYLIEKLAVAEKRKERLRNLEWLGTNMLTAGQELTQGDVYGSALIKCGQTQLKIGQIEREFANKSDRDFIRPLKKFLDEDAKALTREKRALEVKRLDLDAAKGKFKKVRSTDQPQSSNVSCCSFLRDTTQVKKEKSILNLLLYSLRFRRCRLSSNSNPSIRLSKNLTRYYILLH